MSEPKARQWTIVEFFAWQEQQPNRYELVDGRPLQKAWAENRHDDIVVNIVAALGQRLRGGPCRPFTGEGAVETYPGRIRRPDVGVDCGRREANASKGADPRLVVEVLSPTTRDFDTFRKLEEYKSVASLAHVLLVEPNEPLVALWSRSPDGAWSEQRISELDASIELPALGCALPLAEIYDGVAFAPRLVGDD